MKDLGWLWHTLGGAALAGLVWGLGVWVMPFVLTLVGLERERSYAMGKDPDHRPWPPDWLTPHKALEGCAWGIGGLLIVLVKVLT